ncbi:MAG: Trans-aconitate 2-methyltransferase [Candidatus Heimdallarchaeota archaeon LC_3]|nr:MAG: Trans-aconitate 2-methyltransferase [Candidatus Heimdallarchaeota archaeon LC_3]
MLKKAKNLSEEITWVLEDIDKWIPDEKCDLIFSNATLHWLDNHEKLFPILMNHLNPNGVLAIQMPNNFEAPTHKNIYETAKTGPWAESLIPLIREMPVLDISHYYRILNPISKLVNIWQTIYSHFLEGENPVVEWMKGSALRPFLKKLDENMKSKFLKQYTSKIQQFYVQEYDGKTIFPFKRIFIVAIKN